MDRAHARARPVGDLRPRHAVAALDESGVGRADDALLERLPGAPVLVLPGRDGAILAEWDIPFELVRVTAMTRARLR